MNILCSRCKLKSLVEVDTHTEGVAAETRTLHCQDLVRSVGCKAQLFLDILQVVVYYRIVAFKGAGAERRSLPCIVDAYAFVVLAFKCHAGLRHSHERNGRQSKRKDIS